MPKLRLSVTNKLRLRGASRIAATEHYPDAGAGTGGGSATAITVVDFTARTLYQRTASARVITVTGTYTGIASAIQARCAPVGMALSDPAVAWATIVPSPTGGTYSGSLTVPTGGWYVLQVRDPANPVIAASGAQWFGVGIIVALLGQSNMFQAFAQTLNFLTGDKRAMSWSGGTWVRQGNINDTVAPGSAYPSGYSTWTSESGAVKGDGPLIFSNTLSASLGMPVGLLPYAVNGSLMSSWLTGGTNWNTFAAACAGKDFEAAIWLQGEGDAGGSISTYKTNLANLQAQLHTFTGRNSSTFAFGIASLGPATSGWSAYAGFGAMRVGQLEFATGTAGASVAACLHDMALDGADPVHMNVSSRIRYFRRFTEWMRRRVTDASNDMRGPSIASATMAGAVVTVNITHNGGTALRDGAGGAGGSLLGFRVFDGATQAGISNTSISGSAVVLTLSAVPAGAVTLDYAVTPEPYGHPPVAAAVVYDNQTITGDTLGFPLQPKAAITVTS